MSLLIISVGGKKIKEIGAEHLRDNKIEVDCW